MRAGHVVILAAFLTLGAAAAQAASMTGDALYRRCIGNAEERRLCGAYLQGAAAAMGPPPAAALSAIGSLVGPAAMCGLSCRGGGRYIPGPPSVCEDNGMEFCGSSRDVPRRGPYGRGDEYGGRGEGCRTITIEREDCSVRRIRRCD